MNGELLAVLDQIERDTGIKKDILIQAIESALVSAAKKVIHGDKSTADIKAEFDRITGKIKVFEGNKEITS